MKKSDTDAPNQSMEAQPSTVMRIKSINIKNFRSYSDASLNCSPFNILVGRNNHGKSNFIEALEWFYLGKALPDEIKRHSTPSGENVEVVVTFANVQAGLDEILNEDNRKKIKNILGTADKMIVRRNSVNPKKREIFDPTTKDWKSQPCGADPAFNNCIPRFEFIQTQKKLSDVAAYKSTSPIGELLNGLVQSVLVRDSSKEYQLFLKNFESLFGEKNLDTGEPSTFRNALNTIGSNVKTHLIAQFPDCKDLKFHITPPETGDLLKSYQTTLDDGVLTSAEEKGDGMQRALMLAIIKAHADFRRDDALGRSFIFFIDEAELHLHPSAQRQLKESLLKLTQSQDQVFLTTHSSVFIAERHPMESVFSVSKEGGVTDISLISNKSDLQNTVFDMLGGSPADLLLPPNFLIVEGPSEVELLQGIINRFYVGKPNIKIIPAEGDDHAASNQYDAINKILAISGGRAVYGDKIVILLDTPEGRNKQKRFEQFKKTNKKLDETNRLFTLPTKDLESYYPASLSQGCQKVDKVKKAKWMAQYLTKKQFEKEMVLIFQAISKCWELAFKDE